MRGASVLVTLALATSGCDRVFGVHDPDRDASTAVDGGTDAGPDGGADAVPECVPAPPECGRCGRVCELGPCDEGKCMPFVMASTLSLPQRVVGEGAVVYVTEENANQIRWCPALETCASGGGTASTPGSRAYALALDPTRVYATSFGAMSPVGFCQRIACPSLQPFHVSTSGDAISITVAAGSVVFPRGDAILACPGGTACIVATLVTPAVSPRAVLYHGGSLFWVEAKTGTDGVVRSCPFMGAMCTGTIVTYAMDVNLPAFDVTHPRLAADATHVYWTETGAFPRVRRATRGVAGSVEDFAAPEPLPSGVATDGSWVYWVRPSGNAVMACPVAGCGAGPRVFAETASPPTDITLVGQYLYVTTYGSGPGMTDGGLVRIAK